MSVTPASLVLSYPEWEHVNTEKPDVVTQAISQAEDDIDEAVVGDRYDECVMLSASSWLFDHLYGHDMERSSDASPNRYQIRLDEILVRKGSAYRTVWSTSDFGGY